MISAGFCTILRDENVKLNIWSHYKRYALIKQCFPSKFDHFRTIRQLNGSINRLSGLIERISNIVNVKIVFDQAPI